MLQKLILFQKCNFYFQYVWSITAQLSFKYMLLWHQTCLNSTYEGVKIKMPVLRVKLSESKQGISTCIPNFNNTFVLYFFSLKSFHRRFRKSFKYVFITINFKIFYDAELMRKQSKICEIFLKSYFLIMNRNVNFSWLKYNLRKPKNCLISEYHFEFELL